MKIYQQLARSLAAMNNCIKSGNKEWETRHFDKIEEIIRNEFPDGSGFDNGTFFDFELSTPDKLVLHTYYCHMNENGYYVDWTDHSIFVTPSLQFGFNLKITGKNRNYIKDYFNELFGDCLNKELTT